MLLACSIRLQKRGARPGSVQKIFLILPYWFGVDACYSFLLNGYFVFRFVMLCKTIRRMRTVNKKIVNIFLFLFSHKPAFHYDFLIQLINAVAKDYVTLTLDNSASVMIYVCDPIFFLFKLKDNLARDTCIVSGVMMKHLK